jgi:lipopolysaccharide heptosyltransferase II
MTQDILVVGPSWVGDMVVAQSLFKLLHATRSDIAIDVVAPDWSRPLLSHMPEVREAIPLFTKHGEFGFKKRFNIANTLRKRNYQQAIVIPRSFKAALIPFLARIPLRTGWRGEMRWGLLNDVRKLDKNKYPSLRSRYAHLGLLPGVDDDVNSEKFTPEFSISEEFLKKTADKLELNRKSKIIALCPGAEYGPAKQWPAGHFAKIALWMAQLGWQVWLLGSSKDAAIAQDIQSMSNSVCTNLTGRTTLTDAIACLAMSDIALCNDSGLMHIAAAIGKPLIALYGSSDPNYTPPLSEKATVLSLHLSCSPCFSRVCPLGTNACLRDLSPQKVMTALEQYIELPEFVAE